MIDAFREHILMAIGLFIGVSLSKPTQGAGGGGGSPDASLDFSNADNSQYLALLEDI